MQSCGRCVNRGKILLRKRPKGFHEEVNNLEIEEIRTIKADKSNLGL